MLITLISSMSMYYFNLAKNGKRRVRTRLLRERKRRPHCRGYNCILCSVLYITKSLDMQHYGNWMAFVVILRHGLTVTLTGVKLTMYTRLASNAQSLPLPLDPRQPFLLRVDGIFGVRIPLPQLQSLLCQAESMVLQNLEMVTKARSWEYHSCSLSNMLP